MSDCPWRIELIPLSPILGTERSGGPGPLPWREPAVPARHQRRPRLRAVVDQPARDGRPHRRQGRRQVVLASHYHNYDPLDISLRWWAQLLCPEILTDFWYYPVLVWTKAFTYAKYYPCISPSEGVIRLISFHCRPVNFEFCAMQCYQIPNDEMFWHIGVEKKSHG